MDSNVLKAVLGVVGIYMPKKKDFEETDFNKFAKDLPGPAIIFETDRTPSAMARGIGNVTGDDVHHVEIYIGKPLADKIRKKYPVLFGKRLFEFEENQIQLDPVPINAIEHEMIGSAAHIRIKSMNALNNNDTQLVALIPALTEEQKEAAALRAYIMHGMPYDISEIGAHLGLSNNSESGKIILEDNTEIEVGLKVCSSYAGYVIGIDGMLSPGALYDEMKLRECIERTFNIAKHV